MNKIFKAVSKILFAVTIFSAVFANQVSAAEDSEALQAFREALTNSSTDKKFFREDIFFVVPKVQSELEMTLQTDDKNCKMAGNFNLWFVNDSGNTTDTTIPFYLTQTEKDMQIYFQLDKKWYKFQSPSIAAVAADKITTPTANETEEIISEVKSVSILQENDTQRTMLVKLDGNKIADEIKAEAAKNPADNGTAEDKEMQDNFLQYLDSGLRNSEIWYIWTVDKTNWQTVTMSWNLSNLIQATAQAALNDETRTWNDFERNILETVAFYSEVKAFTTALNDEAAKNLEIPKKALKAKPVLDMFPSANK